MGGGGDRAIESLGGNWTPCARESSLSRIEQMFSSASPMRSAGTFPITPLSAKWPGVWSTLRRQRGPIHRQAMSHHRRYRRMLAASGPNRAILSLLCPPMVAAATCPSARHPEIGGHIPLLPDRPRYPRFPVERVRDISCEACESRLLALPPRCSSPELALHTVRRTGQEGTPSTARSAPGGRVAPTRSAISPRPG